MYSALRRQASRLKGKIAWELALSRSRRMMKQLDHTRVPKTKNEIRLFTMARNESLRLPYFLDYYLTRGVDRVFLIDNNSTDDTVALAMKHPNVHVFQTKETFKNYYYWTEVLLKQFGEDLWCVAVDLDELLVFPYCEDMSIRSLTGFMEIHGFTALRCLLLDMYADGEIETIAYHKGEDPIRFTPYFDPEFNAEEKCLYNKKFQHHFKSIRFSGGMRKRMFSVEPNQTKVPLFKYRNKNIYMDAGMHAIDGARIADIRGVVLHFKFLQDFFERTIEETKRGQHADGAFLYKSIAKKYDQNQVSVFRYPGSIRYKNSAQLIDLNLMKSTPEFDNFCECRAIAE
jgi:hypothetical protein